MAFGWIKLHREIQSTELAEEKPYCRLMAWIDLLLATNATPGTKFVRGNVVNIPTGCCGLSERKLAERWGWSKGKVRNFLNFLELKGQIKRPQKSKLTTLIYIVNWQKYQEKKTTDRPTERPQKDHRLTQDKEVKKEKNEKKDLKPTAGRNIIPPSIEMVAAYCSQRNNTIDPQYFVDSYQAKNWMIGKNRMKDWQASVRTWEKNEKDKPGGKGIRHKSNEVLRLEALGVNLNETTMAETNHSTTVCIDNPSQPGFSTSTRNNGEEG